MKWVALVFLSAVAAAAVGCSFAAQECCDCMATKDTIFGGDCLNDSYERCVEQLSRNPPDVETISAWCRAEDNGYCQESCAEILYRK